MKRILIICLFFVSVISKAQDRYLPDEIWYDTGEGSYIHFCVQSVESLGQYADAVQTFPELFTPNMQKQIHQLDPNRKVSIELDEHMKSYRILTSDDVVQVDFLPNEIRNDKVSNFQELKAVTGDGTKINGYFQSTDQMMVFMQNSWKPFVDSLAIEIMNLNLNKHKAVTLIYRKSGSRLENLSKNWNLEGKNLDQMQLTASTGATLFKTQLLPSFEFRLGLAFSKKGILKNAYFLNYEIMFDFASENNKLTAVPGHFLDLGYERNFAKTPDKADWYGFSVGYLIAAKSDIFDDHTWRLSVHRNLTKNVELVPQVYFPSDFSQIFPGLKLKIDF
jgi:hypothetical protein